MFEYNNKKHNITLLVLLSLLSISLCGLSTNADDTTIKTSFTKKELKDLRSDIEKLKNEIKQEEKVIVDTTARLNDLRKAKADANQEVIDADSRLQGASDTDRTKFEQERDDATTKFQTAYSALQDAEKLIKDTSDTVRKKASDLAMAQVSAQTAAGSCYGGGAKGVMASTFDTINQAVISVSRSSLSTPGKIYGATFCKLPQIGPVFTSAGNTARDKVLQRNGLTTVVFAILLYISTFYGCYNLYKTSIKKEVKRNNTRFTIGGIVLAIVLFGVYYLYTTHSYDNNVFNQIRP